MTVGDGMQLNSLDFIILAVVLLSAGAGLKKGLFQVISGLVGILIGLWAAVSFYRALAGYLEQAFGAETILAGILQDKLPLPAFDTRLLEAAGYAPGLLADPVSSLASTILVALSFLLILLLGSKLVQIMGKVLDSLFAQGILAGVNRSLGMILLVAKNLIIMAILVGILLPPLELAARMGMPGALLAVQHIDESLLLEPLSQLFVYLKGLL
jgi:uncharacterized membrane protein required for colicin V production